MWQARHCSAFGSGNLLQSSKFYQRIHHSALQSVRELQVAIWNIRLMRRNYFSVEDRIIADCLDVLVAMEIWHVSSSDVLCVSRHLKDMNSFIV